MRQRLVAGNWKMNGSRDSIEQLLADIVAAASALNQINIAVFPPFVYLSQVQSQLTATAIKWGAQTLSEHTDGAYTGEVTGAMLKEFGCSYAIVGHSERRQLFAESDQAIAQKFVMAKESGLIPVLCVGETLEQRDQQLTQQVVQTQLQAVLSLKGGVNLLRGAVIAYEPVWAIGTGLTATPEQAQAVHQAIRQQVAVHDADIAEQLQILYGGSVKEDNAAGLFAMPDIDGALVGGASLNADAFIRICQAAQG